MGDYSQSRYLAKTGKPATRQYNQTGRYRKNGLERSDESSVPLSQSIRELSPEAARDAFCERLGIPSFAIDITFPLAPIMNFSSVLEEDEFCPLGITYFAFNQPSGTAQADFYRIQLAKSNVVDEMSLLSKIEEYDSSIAVDSPNIIASTVYVNEEERKLLKSFPGFGLVIDTEQISRSSLRVLPLDRIRKIAEETETIERTQERIEWVERLLSGEENPDNSDRISILPFFRERFYNSDGSPKKDKLDKVLKNLRDRIASSERRIRYCELSEEPRHLVAYAHPEIATGRFVVAHEAGHMVQMRFIDAFGDDAPELKTIDGALPLSSYGCTDEGENFAEIYSAYRLAPEELAPAMVSAMDSIVAAVRKLNSR
jgi:uncharacterized protein Smg (DUF494 family)